MLVESGLETLIIMKVEAVVLEVLERMGLPLDREMED